VPFPIERQLRSEGEDDIVSACVEIAQPPGLVKGVLDELVDHGAFMGFEADAVGRVEGAVGVEHRRDRCGDREAVRGLASEPGDVACRADPPASCPSRQPLAQTLTRLDCELAQIDRLSKQPVDSDLQRFQQRLRRQRGH
jgi:hypothetical protein